MPPFWVPPTNRRFPSFHKILFDSGRSIPYFPPHGVHYLSLCNFLHLTHLKARRVDR
jgi:hypothetical protein